MSTTQTQTVVVPELSKLSLKGASDLVFEAFTLPESNQRTLGAPHPPNTVIPLAFQPKGSDTSLEAAIETIKALAAKDEITNLLQRHGTILFRGLPIKTADDFSKFSHAFGYQPHEIVGIVVDRPLLAPNVAPANEAPKEVYIGSHNESPQVPHAPAYIFFYGHQVPPEGGETPISSSLELFRLVQQAAPEFVERLVEQGIVSSVTYKPEATHVGGSTLRQAFGKEIKDGDDAATQRKKIEEQIARYNRGEWTTFKWNDDGSLVLTHRIPVVRTQPGTNLPILFTGLGAYYRYAQTENGRKNPAKQLYGDGQPIEEKYLQLIADTTDKIRVLHKWQQGDVLLYDNRIAQHGRQPWGKEQEDRRVLASLWDGPLPGPYGFAKWATLQPILP